MSSCRRRSRRIFDGALVPGARGAGRGPRRLGAKTRFVTIYHLILESTLGLTTFKFVTDHLGRERLLPGFVEGYSKIHNDETRHIGYGIWFLLRETVRQHPDQADTVRKTLRELLPSVAASLAPPEGGGATDFDAIGASAEAVRGFALDGLTRRPGHHRGAAGKHVGAPGGPPFRCRC